MHWWLSMHCGAESGSAFNGDWAGGEQPWRCELPKLMWLESGVAHTQTVAGWEQPCTGDYQSTVEWRAARRSMGARQAGSSHALVTPKAVWFGGGVAWLHLFLEARLSPRLFCIHNRALIQPLPNLVPHPPPFSRF